ncbi:MAG: class I SAM-dependent methyltransferase [Candidatus Babeliales bacterium]
MNEASIEFAQSAAQRIKELVPQLNRSGVKILDFGCGNGLLTYYLQEVFFESTVIGIDTDKKKIQEVCVNYPEITFQEIKNNEQLPFSDASFDLIVVSLTLHHIQKNKHKKIINELMRVLKKDGYLICLELNLYNFSTRQSFYNDLQEQGNTLLSPRYLKSLLKNIGKTSTYYFNFFSKYLSFFEFLEPYLWWLPFGQWYLVVCKKLGK